jgi:GTP-binding protein
VSEPSVAFDEEALEAARVFFAHPVAFLMGAVAIDGLPSTDLPEVAFAGRSNVGKSSLINAVTGRTHLARASTAPGRTREINFFVCDETLRLVDLPGYGFAKAPKDVVKKWRFLVNDFLRGRDTLKRALVLIDSRHGIKDVRRHCGVGGRVGKDALEGGLTPDLVAHIGEGRPVLGLVEQHDDRVDNEPVGLQNVLARRV